MVYVTVSPYKSFLRFDIFNYVYMFLVKVFGKIDYNASTSVFTCA